MKPISIKTKNGWMKIVGSRVSISMVCGPEMISVFKTLIKQTRAAQKDVKCIGDKCTVRR